jgi:tRNA pseudouridine55 synthase
VSERSGILVLDKPAGVTSFDAVAEARRRLGVRRIGHAGTLDPAAVGVLPLLVGEATKLMPYLVDQDKEYVATVRLGVTTDTHDLAGRVLRTAPVPDLTVEAVTAACRAFVGVIEQVPPMYSALHHEGRRLYELARRGVEVERPARRVTVHALDVERLEGSTLQVRVVCGKGTYVRALAADLGTALGCGAAVEALTRTRVGPYTRERAVPWTRLASAPWDDLLDPATALPGWPAVTLSPREAVAFAHGQAVSAPGLPDPAVLVRVHDADGRLLGIATASDRARLQPVRLLNADRPRTVVSV